MAKYALGKKAIFEEIRKSNIIEVHLLNFFPEIKKVCKEFNIPIILHKNSNFFKQFSIYNIDCVGLLKKSFNLTSDLNSFINNLDTYEGAKSIILLLDSINDVGNFGAIIRTAKAFSVTNIIFKKNNQVQINDTVIKNSMGAISSFNFLKVSNLVHTIEKLKKIGYWIYCSSIIDSEPIENFKIKNSKIALVVGNEANGVSNIVQQASDYKIKISMNDDVNSLNVSVAVGILLFFLSNNF